MDKSLQLLPEYVFRGTTHNFKGGGANTVKPYRCYSTANPMKAAYFAHVCSINFHMQTVIYVAKTKRLLDMDIPYLINSDPLARAEEEVIWEIKPRDFYKHCEGYITFEALKNVLKSIGNPLTHSPNYNTLSTACFETRALSVKKIGKLMEIITPLIKYP